MSFARNFLSNPLGNPFNETIEETHGGARLSTVDGVTYVYNQHGEKIGYVMPEAEALARSFDFGSAKGKWYWNAYNGGYGGTQSRSAAVSKVKRAHHLGEQG